MFARRGFSQIIKPDIAAHLSKVANQAKPIYE